MHPIVMTVWLLVKIGCLLEGAETTTGVLISTVRMLQRAGMTTGPLMNKGHMSEADAFCRVLHIQCMMV